MKLIDAICNLDHVRTLLGRVEKSRSLPAQTPSVKLPGINDCYYVQDGTSKSRPQCLTNEPDRAAQEKNLNFLYLEIRSQSLELVLSFGSCVKVIK